MRVEIKKWVNGGWGLGYQDDGKVVFCANCVPGDIVEIARFSKKKGVHWAEDSVLLEPSPLRQPRTCAHFPKCGGCNLLSVDAPGEASLKQDMVRDVLLRTAKLNDIDWVWRDFALDASRWRGRLQVSRRAGIGFFNQAGNQLVPIQFCRILANPMNDLLSALQQLQPKFPESASLFFAIQKDQQVAFELECESLNPSLCAALAELPGVSGVLCQTRNWGEPWIEADWNGFHVRLSPRAFFQANLASWPFFWQAVSQFQTSVQARSVWDAHAGSGFLITALAKSSLVWASEPESAAILNLQKLQDRFEQLQIWPGTAGSAVKRDGVPLEKLDLVLLDPPRSGLEPELVDQLVNRPVPYVLFFGCDTAAFARDLRKLSEAYRILEPIQIWNTNPGSARLELIGEIGSKRC